MPRTDTGQKSSPPNGQEHGACWPSSPALQPNPASAMLNSGATAAVKIAERGVKEIIRGKSQYPASLNQVFPAQWLTPPVQ